MTRRILSLWLPCFATDRLRRGCGPGADGGGRPLVAIRPDHGRLTIVAADRMAQAAGITPGMPLADARALEPALLVRDADPAGDAAALVRLCDWARRYTPWTAPDPAEQVVSGAAGLWLDVTGCAHLFGGEDGLMEDIDRRLARAGLEGRMAIADTPGAAWALARFGGPQPWPPIMPPGGQRSALRDLPVAALRLPAATVAGLKRVGLHRIGDLLDRPRSALSARYGPLPARRLDEALGAVEEPINPGRPVPPHTARIAFAEPISTADDIARATRQLLEGVCRSLGAAGQGARRLVLEAWRVDAGLDAPPQRVEIGTASAQREPGHLLRLLSQKLERFEPGPGFEVMALSAPVVERFAALQMAAPGLAPEGEGAGRVVAALEQVVDRVGVRVGLPRILAPLPRQSWCPERGVEMRPGDAAVRRPSLVVLWPADRPRPLRLLPWPEPVRVTAPVPDDPPLMFRWRDRLYRVRRAEGPERLAAEWWLALHLPEGEPRDYYRVEAADGRRYWLYRLGLYSPERSAPWYLHGFLG